MGSSANGKVKQEESDHEPPSSDDDLPLAKKSNGAKTNGKAKPSPRKRVKKEESDADASVASEVEKRKHKPAAKRVKKEVKDEVDSDGEPVATPKRARTKKEPKELKPKKPKEQEEEPVYKWWNEEDPEGDGSKKWDTLRHAGVLFPPPYEPLPSNVKMLYDGL
jgi:DNA topoisomerase-1